MKKEDLSVLNKIFDNIDSSKKEIEILVTENKEDTDILELQKEIESMSSRITNLKKKSLRDTINSFLDKLNNKFQSEGLITKGRELIRYYEDDRLLFKNNIEDNIQLMDHRVKQLLIFPNDSTIEDRFKLFFDNKQKIEEEATSMAAKVYTNRSLLKKITEEIIVDLAKEFNLSAHMFSFENSCHYSEIEGIETVFIKYNKSTFSFFCKNFFLHGDFNEKYLKHNMYSSAKSLFKEELIKIEEKEFQVKKNQLSSFLNTISTSRKIKFQVIKDYIDGDKFYNISKGLISIHFDFKDKNLTKLFKDEVLNTIEKILSFEEYHFLNSNNMNVDHIDLAISNYYFIKEEKSIENENGIYKFYKVRGVKRGIRLYIFLNGQRIYSARQRRKILKKYGKKEY